ncbi:MAG: 16S rRNA (uracil(1498)-N(3))-methyltransferase [Epulopiscium sp.]|jgi:16S rRNA (uracil1498-N3)-methyltransferase|nr:16S rRNA (uracil(1498)-N(3))-methyltransferase [Candidatus Epulonipiscium sp.]
MPRFFVEKNQIQGDTIHIEGEDASHITRVLRCRIGEEIWINDKDATDYRCEISTLEKNSVTVHILEALPCQSEPKTKITLYQGLPKAEKMEWIIQKCVELGVDAIVPVTTERCIVKLEKKETKKIERWAKIAESAAKQSGRGKIPEILPLCSFSQAIAEAAKKDGAIIPYENEKNRGIREFSQKFSGESVAVFIGPEGGFSEKEIALAQESGILPVSLGKRILRTETAGMVAVALLLYELE